MIMLFQLSLFFPSPTTCIRIIRLSAVIVMLALSIQMTSAVTTEEEIESPTQPLKLRRMNSDSSTTSLKSGRSPAQNLLIATQSPKGEALEDNHEQKKISPDTVAASLFRDFDLSSPPSSVYSASAAPSISPHIYETLFAAFQTAIDQHTTTISYAELFLNYPHSARALRSFPKDKQFCMTHFCLSFAFYPEITDDALAELINVLRPETLLGQFADDYITCMTFSNNQRACRALKDTIAPCYVDVETLYVIYNFAPALYYGHAALDDKISIIDNFIRPHPHFELLQRWGIDKRNEDYLRSIPTVDEYRCMACDFGCLATYATSNMNKAMIRNWLNEHKATPTLRHAIVEQTVTLMNQPIFAGKIPSNERGAALAMKMADEHVSALDYVPLDPMCQPTDILEALYQTTASRTDLPEDGKIAMQWEVVRYAAAIKSAAAGSMSDTDVAGVIKRVSGT